MSGTKGRARARVAARAEQACSDEGAPASSRAPILELWDGVLTVTIVGIFDEARGEAMMTSLLTTMAEKGSRAALIDLTGIAMMDAAAANHFLRTAQATRLLGAESVVTGITPGVAQRRVDMGDRHGSTCDAPDDARRAARAHPWRTGAHHHPSPSPAVEPKTAGAAISAARVRHGASAPPALGGRAVRCGFPLAPRQIAQRRNDKLLGIEQFVVSAHATVQTAGATPCQDAEMSTMGAGQACFFSEKRLFPP